MKRSRVNVKVEPLRSQITRQWKWLIFTDAFLATQDNARLIT